MNRYIKSAIASLLIAVIVISTYIPSFAVGEPASYSSSYNSGTRNVVATTLNGTNADNYYNGSYEYDVLSEKSSTEIFNSLRSLMITTHKTLSSYNDCHYKADKTHPILRPRASGTVGTASTYGPRALAAETPRAVARICITFVPRTLP